MKDQFQIFYRVGVSQSQYVPDFGAETADAIWMLEAKARNKLANAEVVAKKEAALKWCGHASDHTSQNGGMPWKYALIPDDVVDENMTLDFLVQAGNVA